MTTNQIQVDLKGYEWSSIQTHAMIRRTRATKNELVMDLAKTKAQVAQVQEKPTRLQLLVGYKICTKTPPTNFSSSLRGYYMRLGNEALFLLFYLF